MDKKALSERDICTKYITPALRAAGWDEMLQIREEVTFTKGRIIVRGKLVSRGKAKRADYILSVKPNIPIALIEAKDNTHSAGDGLQQGLEYVEICHIAFDRKPLTRRERAENVRKRDSFSKYGPQARAVLDALLSKYADEGVLNLTDANVLRVTPFTTMGSVVELVRAFGGKQGFEQAAQELQTELYQDTA